MENVLMALAAFALGVYNAERVREAMRILDPNSNGSGSTPTPVAGGEVAEL